MASKKIPKYDFLSLLTENALNPQGESENFIQIREQLAFDPATKIIPIVSIQENAKTKIEDNRVKHLEQAYQPVDYDYHDLGSVIQKRIQIKDKNALSSKAKLIKNN